MRLIFYHTIDLIQFELLLTKTFHASRMYASALSMEGCYTIKAIDATSHIISR